MTLADIDVTVRSEGDHHRLPEKPLFFGFIPIPPASPLADCEEKLALGTDFHHGGAIRGGNPDIALGIDGHPVRLVLVAGHVLADLKDQLVIRIELEQLRLPGVCALKGPEISLRVEGDRGDTAKAGRQHIWVRERVPHRLFPLHTLQCLARAAKPVTAQGRPPASRRLPDSRRRRRGNRGVASRAAAATATAWRYRDLS